MDWKQKYFTELYHHGIKGQRWGRRRYQNQDGSLTPAGKKRYGDGEGSSDRSPKALIKKDGSVAGYDSDANHKPIDIKPSKGDSDRSPKALLKKDGTVEGYDSDANHKPIDIKPSKGDSDRIPKTLIKKDGTVEGYDSDANHKPIDIKPSKGDSDRIPKTLIKKDGTVEGYDPDAIYKNMDEYNKARAKAKDKREKKEEAEQKKEAKKREREAEKNKKEEEAAAKKAEQNKKKLTEEELAERSRKIDKTLGTVKNVSGDVDRATQGLGKLVDVVERNRKQKAVRNSDAYQYTNQELDAKIARMQKEATYNDWKYNKQTSRGAEVAKNVLDTIGSVAVTAGAVAGVALTIKKLLGK